MFDWVLNVPLQYLIPVYGGKKSQHKFNKNVSLAYILDQPTSITKLLTITVLNNNVVNSN